MTDTQKFIMISSAFFILFALYVPSHHVGYADSDLLITIGNAGGIAHPPGYQLYTALLYIFTKIPIGPSLSFRAHMLSAILHALTIGVLFISTRIVLDTSKVKLKQIQKDLISFVSVLTLASSYLFFIYSTIAEKYPLNNLFAALLIYISSILLSRKKVSKKLWLFSGLIIGLGISHHHTFVLIIPSFLYAARSHYSIRVAYALLGFVSAMSLGLVSLFAQNTAPQPNWQFEPSISGFVDQITRKNLSGIHVVTGEEIHLYFIKSQLVDVVYRKIPNLFEKLYTYFGTVPLVLLVAGLLKSAKLYSSQKRLSIYVLLLLATTTLFIPLYLDWPQSLHRQAFRLRQYLLSYIPLPLVVGLGLAYISEFMQKFRLSTNLFLAGAALSMFVIGGIHIHSASLREFNHIERLYTSILQSLPQDSALVCISDISCFALLYQHKVLGVRSDVLIIPSTHMLVKDDIDNTLSPRISYPGNPDQLTYLVSLALQSKRVFVADMQKVYYDIFGVDQGLLSLTSYGYVQELSIKPTEPMRGNYTFSEELMTQSFSNLDPMRLQLISNTAQTHLLNAKLYLLKGEEGYASQELQLANQLSSKLPIEHSINASLEDLKPSNNTIWVEVDPMDAKSVEDMIAEQVSKGLYDKARLGSQHLVIRDPHNPSYHTLHSSILFALGDTSRAGYELELAQALEATQHSQTPE